MKKPQINVIKPDIKNLSIYLRSTKKFGKTTLFRDVVLAKYGDASRGLLVGCGNEVGYKMLDNLNVTQVKTYKDMVELSDWLINEKGKEKVVKKTTDVSDLAGISPYAFYFAPGNRNWDRNMGFNENFLRSEERYQNEMLKCYGHVFLNDVLKRLGIDELQSGQIVGWTYDPENPKIDSMIDFGIFQSTRAADNEDGFEVVFILDFNVDGDIWKKLPK